MQNDLNEHIQNLMDRKNSSFSRDDRIALVTVKPRVARNVGVGRESVGGAATMRDSDR